MGPTPKARGVVKTDGPVEKKPAARTKRKDPGDSHLFTDDNPRTTLHGTGFKDAATANKTLGLVARRSLTYQFQTINTMLYRAKHHPHKSAGMAEAIEIFQNWVDTYKSRKADMRDFPLLQRETVAKYLDMALLRNEDSSLQENPIDTEFANMYVDLPKKKRLANTLLNDLQPDGEDWEVRRYNALNELVPGDKGVTSNVDALWESAKKPTDWHLRLIMWGFSPVKKLK